MGEAAALLAALTWSATSVAMTHIGARTSPIVLSGLRLLTGSILLALAVLVFGQQGEVTSASAVTILSMVGSGTLGFGVGDTVYIRALGELGVQRAVPVATTLFIALSVAGSVLLLDEPFGWLMAAGTVLIAAGIFLIVVSRPAAPPASVSAVRERHPLGGYALVAVVGCCWAGATIWFAAGREELGAVAAASLRTPAAAVSLLAVAAFARPSALRAPFRDPRHIGAIVALGIVSAALGTLMYAYAIGEAGAARTTVLNSVSPLMALPLAVYFLGERLTPRVTAGAVLSVLGVILVVTG